MAGGVQYREHGKGGKGGEGKEVGESVRWYAG